MHLAEVRQLDDVVLLRYLLGGNGPAARTENRAHERAERDAAAGGSPGDLTEPGTGAEATDADLFWLAQTIELSRRCSPSPSAFCVGAVVVAADGTVMATGYSREAGPYAHAEEAALAKIDPADSRLTGATLYSSLEPCRVRASQPTPCAELIIAAGLRRVVIARHYRGGGPRPGRRGARRQRRGPQRARPGFLTTEQLTALGAERARHG
jgi:pyrimidine deaminase RibD-like protein